MKKHIWIIAEFVAVGLVIGALFAPKRGKLAKTVDYSKLR